MVEKTAPQKSSACGINTRQNQEAKQNKTRGKGMAKIGNLKSFE